MNTRDFSVKLEYALIYHTPTLGRTASTRRTAEVTIPVTTMTRKEADRKFRVLKKKIVKRCHVCPGIKHRDEYAFTTRTENAFSSGLRKLPEEIRDVEFEIRSYEGVWYRKVYCRMGNDRISDLPAIPDEEIQNTIDCTKHAMWVSRGAFGKGRAPTFNTAKEASRFKFGPYDTVELLKVPGDAQFIANSGHDLGDAIAHTRSFTDKFIIILENEDDKRGELWEVIERGPWPGED